MVSIPLGSLLVAVYALGVILGYKLKRPHKGGHQQNAGEKRLGSGDIVRV